MNPHIVACACQVPKKTRKSGLRTQSSLITNTGACSSDLFKLTLRQQQKTRRVRLIFYFDLLLLIAHERFSERFLVAQPYSAVLRHNFRQLCLPTLLSTDMNFVLRMAIVHLETTPFMPPDINEETLARIRGTERPPGQAR